MPFWTARLENLAAASVNVQTVDIWRSTTTPVETETVRTVRLSLKKSGWINEGLKSSILPTFMWCLHFPMNSIPSFTVTRSFSTVFCTGAPPKHSLSYQGIRSISAQHQASFRFSIPGIRNWITMCTSTVLFPAEGLPPTRKSVNPKAGFSFR